MLALKLDGAGLLAGLTLHWSYDTKARNEVRLHEDKTHYNCHAKIRYTGICTNFHPEFHIIKRN
jgi:hypothetical protein